MSVVREAEFEALDAIEKVSPAVTGLVDVQFVREEDGKERLIHDRFVGLLEFLSNGDLPKSRTEDRPSYELCPLVVELTVDGLIELGDCGVVRKHEDCLLSWNPCDFELVVSALGVGPG